MRLIDKDKLINQIKANTTIATQEQYEILKAIEQSDELSVEELTAIKVGDVVRDTDFDKYIVTNIYESGNIDLMNAKGCCYEECYATDFYKVGDNCSELLSEIFRRLSGEEAE